MICLLRLWLIALLIALSTVCELAAAQLPPAFPIGEMRVRSYDSDDGLANISVLVLLQDHLGLIWVGTDDGVYRYDGHRFERFGLEQGLLSTAVSALHEDKAKVFWAGTAAGLSRWDGESFMSQSARGLPEGRATAISDYDGSLWVGSAKGVYSAREGARFSLVEGWQGGEVSALKAGKAGIWVAGWQGAPRLWQWRDGLWRSFEGPSSEERVDVIGEHPNRTVYARTARQLWALEPQTQMFAVVSTPKPLISPHGYLHLGSQGELWVPSDNGALQLLNGEWQSNLRGAAVVVRTVLEDSEGSLWLGATGLSRVLGRGIFHAYGKAQGLPGNVPWCIFRDSQQTLWVGTDQGLSRQAGERFEQAAGSESLPVRSIVDRSGVLWASTDGAGLYRADTALSPLSFTRVVLPADSATEFMSDLHQDAQGRLWVAGQFGLVMRENDRWRRFTTADGLLNSFVAYVRSTNAGELLIAYFEPRGFARARFSDGQLTVLQHYDSSDPGVADKLFFLGEDANRRLWVGGGRGIDLITLKGVEHFGVADGLMGEDTAGMAIHAEPNGDVWWWQSWWWRVLLGLATTLAVIMIVRLRFTTLRLQNRELETRVTLRTAELSHANAALQEANAHLQSEVDDRATAELKVHQRNEDLEILNAKLAGTQNQLLQSEKMASVGQLAAGVAHEINNPVGYVYSNLGSLTRYIQDLFSLLQAYEKIEQYVPPQQKELADVHALKAHIEYDYLLEDTGNLLKESRDGLIRVEKIVKDLKDFSHVDEPEWQQSDIHKIIESTLNVVAHEFKYKIELVRDYGNLPLIRCLPFQLNQVFLNLLINAGHSIEGRGRITIRSGVARGSVWVEIADTGGGITAAHLKRIFEPFFTTKAIGVGTGLGLSVAWGIVQTHRGSLDVKSELGKGTVFTLTLPIDAELAQREAP